MNNITGAFTNLMVTQRNEVQPDKVSVTPTSVQKATSSVSSGTTEVMANPWLLVEDCSKQGHDDYDHA